MNASVHDNLIERLQQQDLYRMAVDHHLGAWLEYAQGSDVERLRYVDRCFDWGVSPLTCARTWVARVSERE
jgi:hypothetical protein